MSCLCQSDVIRIGKPNREPLGIVVRVEATSGPQSAWRWKFKRGARIVNGQAFDDAIRLTAVDEHDNPTPHLRPEMGGRQISIHPDPANAKVSVCLPNPNNFDTQQSAISVALQHAHKDALLLE